MAEDFVLGHTTTAIRDLPANSFLLHATNCMGEWGAGIAAKLADVFPTACNEYKAFCHAAKPKATAWPSRSVVGQCLIIPPQEKDVESGVPRVYIVCLFTSYGYGKGNKKSGKPGKDGVEKILRQTGESLGELRRQLDEMGSDESETRLKSEDIVIYSPMFNSGAFGVPWQRTTEVIFETLGGWKGRWFVMEPPSGK